MQRDLAKYSDAVISSQHAAALWPGKLPITVNLATGQIQAGDFKGAKMSLDRAIAAHIDGDPIRIRYLELAYALHDPDVLQAQRAWSKEHPSAVTVALGEGLIAVSEGRFADARRFALHSSELAHEQGLGGAGDQFAKSIAVAMIESGAVEDGKRLFHSFATDPEEGQDLLGMVYEGDLAAARSSLHNMQAKYPQGTLWNLYYGPEIRAVAALAEHKPSEAAAILEKARPIEMRELVVPWMRGTAYLAAGQPNLAEKDFRQVVTHPETDPHHARFRCHG